MGWPWFLYLLGAACLGIVVGAGLMLWYMALRSHQDAKVTMSHERRYAITKIDEYRG